MRRRVGSRGLSPLNLAPDPLVSGSPDRIEVHLPGFSGDLHGKTLEVGCLARLREERRFAGGEDLRAAIRADVEATLTLR